MQVNKTWKIESDSMNIILLKARESKDGAETYGVEGYFYSVAEALRHLVDAEVKATGLRDVVTINAKIQELRQLVDKLAVGQFTVNDLMPEGSKNASCIVLRPDNDDNPQEDATDTISGPTKKEVLL